MTFRTAQRPNNAHALLNSCFRATVSGGTISNPVLCYGVSDLKAVFATKAQEAMDGKALDMTSLVSKNDEFCIKTRKCLIKNEDF